MYKIAPYFLILLSLLALTSCQTLSKEECVSADWRVIGEQDGAEGRDPQKRFARHAKACEKAGVVANQTLWNEGYQTGLFKFCTPQRGLTHGQAGNSYNNVCPPALEPGFMSGYRLGVEEYQKKSEIRSRESRISGAERSIADLETKLKEGKGDQIDLERAISRNREDIRRWNREIGGLEADLGNIQRRIQYFQQNPNIGQVYN